MARLIDPLPKLRLLYKCRVTGKLYDGVVIECKEYALLELLNSIQKYPQIPGEPPVWILTQIPLTISKRCVLHGTTETITSFCDLVGYTKLTEDKK